MSEKKKGRGWMIPREECEKWDVPVDTEAIKAALDEWGRRLKEEAKLKQEREEEE